MSGLLAALVIGGCSVGDEPSGPPQLGARAEDEEAAAKLGFPAAATKNTVRVPGGDAAADLAGVASAVYPGTSGPGRPTAVVLVDKDDWQAGVTASVLTGKPIGAPILAADGDELPPITKDTLDRLKPKGSDLSKDAQVIRIGGATARPEGFRTALIEGADPYARAAAIDRFFSAARGKPSENVVVASGERSEWAMPAAAWAAFSGDSVLLTRRESLPEATRKAIAEHERPNIYVLGPRAAVGDGVVRQLERLGKVERVQGPTPVQNAIAFARYERDGFGWRIITAGHAFTLASTSRPLDAAAAAALTASGVPAPLLLTNRADSLPKPLDFYLLNVQPGFEGDRRDVAYSRAFVLGDESTISVEQQARLDRIVDLIPVEANEP